MFDVVAVPTFATIGAAAVFTIAAASYMAKRRFEEHAFSLPTTFAFWQALAGAGLSVIASKKQAKAANAQVAAENAKALADREASAKAAALASLENAKARTQGMTRGPTANLGGIGCSTFFLLLLGGISALLVMACR